MGQPEDLGKPPITVNEVERPQTPPAPPTHKKRRLWEKVGIYNLLVLVLGTAAIFLALAFLISEWIVSKNAINGGKIPSLWRLIFRYKWTARVMTLSSVLIRLATAAQLGVFAAIIAALILEKVGVPRTKLPQVSMIRCSNSGPHSLALSLLDSIFTVRILPYSFLVILAILDAFALQFTSTILLGDYRDAQVVLGSTHEEIKFGFSTESSGSSSPYSGVEYWNAAPVAYSRFAEYKEEGSKSANYIDTGKTYRGFLPFRDITARSTLRSYTGPMTVVDARVICVRPTLSDVSFDALDAYGNFPTFRAQYNWKNTHPDIVDGDEFSLPLNCSIPVTSFFMGRPYWATSLCGDEATREPPARLSGGIRPDYDDSSLPHGHTSIHVLLNTTGAPESWLDMKSANKTLEQVKSSQGPWTHLRGDGVTLDVSVCFTNPIPSSYKVDVRSKVDRDDATMEWISAKKVYETSNVRKMLGALDKSFTLEERGLLQLEHPANWSDTRTKYVYNIDTIDFIWDTLKRNNPWGISTNDTTNDAVSSSAFCENSEYKDSVHRTHVAIFQQTLQETGNPALALQAVWTVLMQMAYYDFLPLYEGHAKAKYTLSSSVNIPTQQRALAIVLGLIGLHFALVLIAVLLFLRTEMSLLGNTWQAISQVMSTDTADLVHRGATATDGEVFHEMKASGIAEETVRITKCENSGRAQATAVRRRQGDQV